MGLDELHHAKKKRFNHDKTGAMLRFPEETPPGLKCKEFAFPDGSGAEPKNRWALVRVWLQGGCFL